MIKIDQNKYAIEITGTAATILTEFVMGLRIFREDLIENLGQEKADKLISEAFERCKMSKYDILKDAILNGDEITKTSAFLFCEKEGKTDDDMLDFLKNLVDELQNKEDK